VGPDEEKFTIHRDIATKARYFAGCLDSSLQESQTMIIKLPEDEPAVIAKLLEYLYSGKFVGPTFNDPDEKPSQEEISQILLVVKSYIMADKYCMENFQNLLMDMLYDMKYICTTNIVSALADAKLLGSPMARYVLRHMARKLFKHGYDRYCSSLNDLDNLIRENGPLAHELVKTLATFGSTKEPDAVNHLPCCEWHVHKDGKKC
jgi:hypothetical protein